MPGLEVEFWLFPHLARPPPALPIESDAGLGLCRNVGPDQDPGGPTMVNDTCLAHPLQRTPTGLPLT